MSIAMDEEAIGEHELKLRNLLATLHTDVDLSRPQGVWHVINGRLRCRRLL